LIFFFSLSPLSLCDRNRRRQDQHRAGHHLPLRLRHLPRRYRRQEHARMEKTPKLPPPVALQR